MHLKRILNSTLFHNNFKKSLLKTSQRYISNIGTLDMPIVDIDKFLNKGENWERECKTAAECLNQSGIMIVRDTVNNFY